MKRFVSLMAAAALLAGLSTTSYAQSRHVGGWVGGHGGHYYGGGHHYGGGWRGFGIGLAAGLLTAPLFARAYYGPPAYYYSPPPVYYSPPPTYYYGPSVYYSQPVVRTEVAPTYIEQEERVEQRAAPATSYWFYCRATRTYYPYVKTCAQGWEKVPTQPADSPR